MRNFTSLAVTLFQLFILALFVAGSAAAQNGIWQQSSGPVGGNVNTFASNENGDLFAGTEGGGVYRSSNNGGTWSPINTGLTNTFVRALALHSRGDLFAGTSGGGVFRSSDNGDTWTPINSGLTSLFVTTIAFNINDILVGTLSGGVFRSRDNGDSWTAINTGLIGFGEQLDVLAFAIDNIGEIFAGTSNRVFSSRDNGDSWTSKASGMAPNTYVLDLLINEDGFVFAATNTTVYRSSDKGLFWFDTGANLPLDPNVFVSTLSVNSQGTLFVGTYGNGVFRSSDNGLNWFDINTGLTNMYIGQDALAFKISKDISGNDREDFFAGTLGGGIFRAANTFGDWSPVNIGLTNSDISSLLVKSNGDIFAGTFNYSGYSGGEVARSTDGGDSWRVLKKWPLYSAVMALATNSNGDMFAALDGASEGNGVYGSNDNGNSWSLILGFFQSGASVVHVAGNDDLFVGGSSGGVSFSSDNGTEWDHIGLTNEGILSLATNSSGDLFAGTYSGVWRSLSNDTSWVKINTGLPTDNNGAVNALAVNAMDHLFAGTEGGLFRSLDNGNSWSPVFSAVRTFAISNEGVMFAGGESGVFRSVDDGNSWQSFNTGLTITRIHSLGVSAGGEVYAGTRGGGVFGNTVTSTAVQENPLGIPASFALEQNYPNPFNPETRIRYHLSTSGHVLLEVFNLVGQRVETLINRTQREGTHDVVWSATDLPSGVYLYRLTLEAGNVGESRRMILLK